MYQNLEQVQLFFSNRSSLGIKPGLDRMTRLLELHDNPQNHIQAIHIAGTNGKGSTLSYIKAALTNNNFQVGVFTSPSLTGLTGHILLGDNEISENQFVALFNELLPSIKLLDEDEQYPTEFEIITVIALLFFKDNVDIAIIETGMGGREDSTNCISPILSIITNIAKDHAHFLGESLEAIAYQKAGIIKESTPTVIGNISESCLSIIYEEANQKNSDLYQLNKDFYCSITSKKNESQLVEWRHHDRQYQINIKMLGNHQVTNVGLAIMALQLLKKELNWDKVVAGLSNVSIPARFEKVNQHPLVILDGAHNVDGMNAFLSTVHDLYGSQRKILVFAGFRDKELHKMVEAALLSFDSIIITTFNHPRAAQPKEIATGIDSNKIIIADWKQVLKQMDTDYAYFFAGSLHFIGMVRKYIKEFC